jgi:hypothetical protein
MHAERRGNGSAAPAGRRPQPCAEVWDVWRETPASSLLASPRADGVSDSRAARGRRRRGDDRRRRHQAAGAPRGASPARESGRLDRSADRGIVGRARADHVAQGAARVRLTAEEGARRRPHRHDGAGVSAPGRSRRDRPRPVRGARLRGSAGSRTQRSGAGNRSPTSPTSRSRRPRSPASRSCASALSRSGSSASSMPGGTQPSSASSRPSLPPIRRASGFAGS